MHDFTPTDNFYSRALGDKEAKNEFNELFDDLIVDVCESTAKYSDIVKQLEALLELEKETLVIKRKVSTFSLDYDDDLVIVHTIKSVMIKNMKISNLHVKYNYLNDCNIAGICGCFEYFQHGL